MKKIYILLLLILSVVITAKENPEDHEIELNYIRGMQAYEAQRCKTVTKEEDGKKLELLGAITYFEKYLTAKGDPKKIIKYLAFCKVKLGIENKDKLLLQEGLEHLEKIFEKDNNNTDVLKLLYALYISSKEYTKAKTYTPIIIKLAEKEKKLYIVISRLYFQLKEYKKVVEYINKYPKDPTNKEEYVEVSFLNAYSLFELQKYKESKVILIELKTIGTNNINLDKAINDRLNYIKNLKTDSNYDIVIHNGIVFDSNITSRPSLSEQYQSDNPLISDIDDFDLSGMGARDETYIGLSFYPFLNTEKHTFIVGSSLFSGIHYPYKVGDFNPSDYDILSASVFTGYKFHNNYKKSRFFNASVNLLGNMVYSNILYGIINHNNNISLMTNLFFSISDTTYGGFKFNINFKDYNSYYSDPDLESQDGMDFSTFMIFGFLINDNNLNFKLGYIKDLSQGTIFKYNGTLLQVDFSTILGSLVKLDLSSYLNYRWYPVIAEKKHKDTELSASINMTFLLSKSFNLGIKYRYIKNSSTIKLFSFDKHIGGVFFNIIF